MKIAKLLFKEKRKPHIYYVINKIVVYNMVAVGYEVTSIRLLDKGAIIRHEV